jgi:hypothetical protein
MAVKAIEDRLNYDKDATNLVIAYKEGIADEVLSISPLIKRPKSGYYPSYGRGEWQYLDFEARAIGDPNVKQITFPAVSWTEYFIPEVPRKKFIDSQAAGRSGVVGLVDDNVQGAAERVKYALNQALSYKIITAALAGVGGTTTPVTKWNSPGSDATADLNAAIDAFEAQCGLPPNGIVIPSKVLRYCGKNVRAAYGVNAATPNVGLVKEILMTDLGIPTDRIFISYAHLYGTSSFANMYTNAVLLFYSATNPNMIDWEPSYMGSIIPDDVEWFRVKTPYESEDKNGYYVQCIMEIQPKVLLSYAGYSITATLA